MLSGFLDFFKVKMKHKCIPQRLQILQSSYLHSKQGGKATGLTSEPMQGMSITLRKSTILITGSFRQKIHRESRTTILFHVLSQFKLSHQKPPRERKTLKKKKNSRPQKTKQLFLFQCWSEFFLFFKQQSHRLQHISPINSTSLMKQINSYPGNNASSHKDQLVLTSQFNSLMANQPPSNTTLINFLSPVSLFLPLPFLHYYMLQPILTLPSKQNSQVHHSPRAVFLCPPSLWALTEEKALLVNMTGNVQYIMQSKDLGRQSTS